MSAMMLGEISPGGVGSGLYGLIMVALIAVFLGGLMVSRTPEYLRKRIRASEMKMVALYYLATPIPLLAVVGLAIALPAGRASIGNPGAHGLSEVVYAFTSAANSNGSAFGGLSGGTTLYLLGWCQSGEPVECQGLGAKGTGAEDEGEDDLEFSHHLVEGHPAQGLLGRCGSW